MTRGENNRNPGNLKRNMDNPYRGQIGIDDDGHAIFSDVFWGIRAMIRSLQLKAQNGKTTIAAIVDDWTEIEKDKTEYTGYIANWLGVRSETPLHIFSSQGSIVDPLRLVGLIEAMSAFENRHWMPKHSDIFKAMGYFEEEFGEART